MLQVSKSGYYKWKYRKANPSKREKNMKLIKQVHKAHPSHGYRWLHKYIENKYRKKLSLDYFRRCCKYENIRSEGKHYRWTKPGNKLVKYNNSVWNNWKNVNRPFQIIVSDMTSFYANKTYYELTMYFDVWNKEILGYGLSSKKGDVTTYFEGLTTTLKKLKKEQAGQTILHTDQGSVYSSKQYNLLIEGYNIKRSMSRAGTPTDNPVNESLNGWIKEELFLDFNLKKCKDVNKLIKEYIEYYNNDRPSYALNYKTPIQYKIELGF